MTTSKEKRVAAMLRKLELYRDQPPSDRDIEDFRLPPGQSWVRKGFPVLDLGEHPEIKEDDWRLEISGLVSQPVDLTAEQLLEMQQVELVVDIHCVTAWSVPDALWHGVPTTELLKHIDLTIEASHALVHSYDGYSANLPLSDLFCENAIIAYALNGQPLSISHGGPFRLVIPHLYFWKSPKWIKRIEFLDEDTPGFWEQRGYHNRGNPWEEERVEPKPVMPSLVELEPAPQAEDMQEKEVIQEEEGWMRRIIGQLSDIFRIPR